MRGVLFRYLKFVGTSLLGTALETLVLWLLSDHVFNNGWAGEYLISPLISFQAAVLLNFIISYFYVWRDRRAVSRRRRSFLKRYLAYNLSCSGVYLVRYGFLLLVGRLTGWDVVFCNLLAMCFSGILNFLLTNNFVFRKKD